MDPNQNQQSFQFIANDEFLNLLCDRENGNQMLMQDEQIALSKYYNQHQGCEQEQQWIFGQPQNDFEMRFEHEPDHNPFFNERRDQRSVSFLGAQMLIPKEYPKKPKEKQIIEDNKELFLANQSKSIYLSKISQLLKDNEINSSKQIKHSVSPTSKNQLKITRKHTSSKEYEDSGSGLQFLLLQIHQIEKLVQNERLAKNRESARNSRKRKKVYVELLENKVAELSEELKNVKDLCEKQQNYINKFTDNTEHFQQFLSNQQQWLHKAGQLISMNFQQTSYQQNLSELSKLERLIAAQTNEILQIQRQKVLLNSISFPINHLLEGLNSDISQLANCKNLINEVFDAYQNVSDSVEVLQQQFQNVFTQQQNLQQCYDRLMNECDQSAHQHLLLHILEVYILSINIKIKKKFQKQEANLESSGGVLTNLQRKLIKIE